MEEESLEKDQDLVPEEATLRTRSGLTPEELFDVLVGKLALEATSSGLIKRKLRGAVKNVLRTAGVGGETVAKLTPTKQDRFIESELRGLPSDKQRQIKENLFQMERKRVVDSITSSLSRLNDPNLRSVVIGGSILSGDKWPSDIDVTVVMDNPNMRSAKALKRLVEEDIHKRFHIKKIASSSDESVEGLRISL